MERTFPLQRLPRDVLGVIINMLLVRDAWNCWRTCKLLRDLVERRQGLRVRDVSVGVAFRVRRIFPALHRLRIKGIRETYRDDAQYVLEQLVCITSLRHLHVSATPVVFAGALSLCSRLPSLTSLTIDASRACTGVPSQEMLMRLKALKVRMPNALAPLDLAWYKQKYLSGDQIDGALAEEALVQRVLQAASTIRVLQELFQTEIYFREGIACLVTWLQEVKQRKFRCDVTNLDCLIALLETLHARGAGFTLENLAKLSAAARSPHPLLGRFLLSQRPYLEAFTAYIGRHNRTQELIDELSRDTKYMKWRHAEPQPPPNLPRAETYLVYPLGRLPRYRLLMEDFIKNHDTFGSESAHLFTASCMLTHLAAQCNNYMRTEELLHSLLVSAPELGRLVRDLPPTTTLPSIFSPPIQGQNVLLYGYLHDHVIMTEQRGRPIVLPLREVTWRPAFNTALCHGNIEYVFATGGTAGVPLPRRPVCRLPPAPSDVRSQTVLYADQD